MSSSSSSFSQLARYYQLIEKLLKIDINSIATKKMPFDKMITIKQDVNYDDMLADLYKSLYKRYCLYGDPGFAKQEFTKSIFVEMFLAETLHFAIQNKGVFSTKTVKLEHQSELMGEAEVLNAAKGIADYVVSVVSVVRDYDSKPRNIVIVNADNVQDALPNCFLGMESAYRTNGDGRVVYGLATDSYHWIVCAYQGKLPLTALDHSSDWQVSKPIEAFDEILNEKSWKAGPGGKLAKVLFTIFDEEIKILKEPLPAPSQVILTPDDQQKKAKLDEERKELARKWIAKTMNQNSDDAAMDVIRILEEALMKAKTLL